jgi:hypothetical protein
MNGFPADAYGWGGEDDEMRRRAVSCGAKIARNTRGTFTDLEASDLPTIQDKLAWLRDHPGQKNMRKWELRDAHAATWYRNGLTGPLQPWVARAETRSGVEWLTVGVP